MIQEKAWKQHIAALKKKTKQSNKAALKKALVNAVVSRVPKQKFGILFSGGLDSSLIALICKQQKADFVCYTVGLKGSDDILWAKKTAKKLKLKLKTKVFALKDVFGLFKKTAAILNHIDVLSVGVGAVLFSAVGLAKKDKIKTLFTGLGSEELFAGYHWHRECKDVNAECWKRLKTMWHRDILRDSTIAKATSTEFIAPFLDDKVILSAMGVSGEKKINSLHNKLILREIAVELGLPKSVAFRPKKAAQYGSRFDWALAKAAKQAGFKTKKDFVAKL